MIRPPLVDLTLLTDGCVVGALAPASGAFAVHPGARDRPGAASGAFAVTLALAVRLAPGSTVRSRSPWRPGQRCARGRPDARADRALAVALTPWPIVRSRSAGRRAPAVGACGQRCA